MELLIFSGVAALIAVILFAFSSLSTPEETVVEDCGSFVRFRATGSPSRRIVLLRNAMQDYLRRNPSARIAEIIWLGSEGSNRNPNRIVLLLHR